MFRSRVLNVLGAVAIVIVVFLVTTFILQWQSGSQGQQGLRQGEPLFGKLIVLSGMSGSATASTPALRENTVFKFDGNGFARIVGSSSLKCLTQKCNLSATVEFATTTPTASGEVIVGQSTAEGGGWHLLWVPGQLILQPQGGGAQINAPFSPDVSRPYAVQIANGDRQVTMSIDGKVVGTSEPSPFTDTALDVTVGGRGGSVANTFVGKISNLRIVVR
jgi:hypothetical protein